MFVYASLAYCIVVCYVLCLVYVCRVCASVVVIFDTVAYCTFLLCMVRLCSCLSCLRNMLLCDVALCV